MTPDPFPLRRRMHLPLPGAALDDPKSPTDRSTPRQRPAPLPEWRRRLRAVDHTGEVFLP